MTIAALNYRVPLPTLGDSFDLYAVYAGVDAGVVERAVQRARARPVAGLRYTMNLKPTANLRHRLLLGVEQRPIDNQVGLVDGSDDLSPDITLNPASLGYAGGWSEPGRQVERRSPRCTTCRAARAARARPSRRRVPAPSANYALLRYALKAQQALPYDWQVRVAFDGQYTGDALVSGEQFGIGGQDSVRGFDERELVDDRGERPSLELQTPDFGERLGPRRRRPRAGVPRPRALNRNRPLPGEATSVSIASVGAGLRVAIPPHYQLRLDLAHVTRGFGDRPRGDDHVHFSLGIAY